MKIGEILKSVWMWVSGNYKKLTSEKNVDAAIKSVNVIKELSNSQLLGWIVSITNTGIDNKIVEVIKNRVPKILASLMLLKNLPEKPTQFQVEELLRSFLKTINENESERERLLTSLSAEILVSLEDGVITFGEAAAIVEKVYRTKTI